MNGRESNRLQESLREKGQPPQEEKFRPVHGCLFRVADYVAVLIDHLYRRHLLTVTFYHPRN